MKPYLIILYLFSLVLIGAAADGMNTHTQTWGHIVEPIELFMAFMAIPLFGLRGWKKALTVVLVYTCFRIGVYDFVVNIAAGQDLFYFGGDNLWDKFWIQQVPYTRLYPSVGCVVVGVLVTIRQL